MKARADLLLQLLEQVWRVPPPKQAGIPKVKDLVVKFWLDRCHTSKKAGCTGGALVEVDRRMIPHKPDGVDPVLVAEIANAVAPPPPPPVTAVGRVGGTLPLAGLPIGGGAALVAQSPPNGGGTGTLVHSRSLRRSPSMDITSLLVTAANVLLNGPMCRLF